MYGTLAAWRHARRIALLALASGAVLCGCMARSPDGSACQNNSDCHSGYCSGQYCAGTPDCHSDSDCESGWTCESYTSFLNSVGNFFGGSSHSTICAATCGYCPANQHCSAGATTGLCQRGSMLIASAGGPYEATVNVPVTLSATAQSSADVVSFAWSVGATAPLSGATVSYAFPQVSIVTVGVTVTDSTGNQTNAQTSVDVRVGAGGMCTQYQQCRSTLTCNGGVCM
jgi:hypothetical protein